MNKRNLPYVLFDSANLLMLLIFSLVIIIPILHLLASSVSSKEALIHASVGLWPKGITLDNYILVMQNQVFWNSFKISIFVTAAGTLLNLYLTLITAYPLSKINLMGRRFILLFIVFTMIFSAPLIPYYLVVKIVGLVNTLGALMIPSAISAFNLILCITFFKSLPEELSEAAKVDGMSEYGILWKIYTPLSMPIIMTLLLFYSVSHWNNYMAPMFFITDPSIKPLQLYLYTVLSQFNTQDSMLNIPENVNEYSPIGLQMATVAIATVPVVIIYPFIQKHFIKGALLGSIKE